MNARQVEPGGMEELWSEGSILQHERLEFKHLCDDWREGFYWQEAFDFSLSSECEEDKIGLLQPN